MGRAVTTRGFVEDILEPHYRAGFMKGVDKKGYMNIARELCYSQKVIQMIEEAETEKDILKIMHDARNGLL